jgi:hypothetical protein
MNRIFICMLVGIAKSGSVDWNNLQIVERIDEEGRFQGISEEQMFNILGFKVQEERAQKKKSKVNVVLLELFLLYILVLMVQVYM